jgi:hypothetical protein
VTSILEGALERAPFAGEGGRTGATFERALLRDGTRVVLKHVTPEDWFPKAIGTTDTLYRMWTGGLFARVPQSIDHLTLAVESDGDRYVIVMRDASEHLLGDQRILTKAENALVLRALDDLHAEFWGERIDGLASLRDHYAWVTPKFIASTDMSRSDVWRLILRGWEVFESVTPRDISGVIMHLLDDPDALVGQLELRPQTIVHGDARLHNMGLAGDRLVLFDWEVCGHGPPALDFAWYLIISASRIDASREQVIAEYREAAGERFDSRATELALIGALLRLGWNKALDIVDNPDDSVRAQERADLDWWIGRVRKALETWSPV